MKRTQRGLVAMMVVMATLFTTYATYAQAINAISISADTTRQGEKTVLQVTVAASAIEKIQGITFQLKYDPACLQPSGFQSLVLNLNNTSMPQNAGLVEGIFTSTEPLTANGGMVNVNFTPLKACQNELGLVKADLVVLSPEGFAQPMSGVSVNTEPVTISVGPEQVSGSIEPTQSMSVLDESATPNAEATPETSVTTIPEEKESAPSSLERTVVILAGILILFAGVLAALVTILIRGKRKENRRQPKKAKTIASSTSPEAASAFSFATEIERYLSIRRGIQSGTRVKLENFPFALGNSPANDFCLEDPSISAFHAKLFLKEDTVILVDLGNPMGTNVNGHTIHNQKIEIKNGDVIKIGAVVLTYSQI